MKLSELIRNTFTSRTSWLRSLIDPRRDLDAECGHPAEISLEDYHFAFKRGDVSKRVVNLYPEESWKNNPEIFETEDPNETDFETSWNELMKLIPVYSYLARADMLSGIGRYGIILLGFDDGLKLEEPVEGINEQGEKVGNSERRLLYMRPLAEKVATIQSLETNTSNPRYGLPVKYNVTFSDGVEGTVGSSGGVVSSTLSSQVVHWSRMIHLADNRTNSEVYGTPRMEAVFNRLLDLKKIAGGSGEMFYKGGFPGLSLETQPQVGEDIEIDKVATKEQMESYMNGLQRYLLAEGMTAKSLTVQVADPIPHFQLQMQMIAIALGCPMRKFMGSERGELASSQDSVDWNGKLKHRQDSYLNPFVLKPFLDRLIAVGVLPEPVEGYQIEWPDLNSPSDEERAGIADKQSNAMSKYVQSGADVLMPPFHYLTLILGMSEDEANSVIEKATSQQDEDRLVEDDEVEPEVRGVVDVSSRNGV